MSVRLCSESESRRRRCRLRENTHVEVNCPGVVAQFRRRRRKNISEKHRSPGRQSGAAGEVQFTDPAYGVRLKNNRLKTILSRAHPGVLNLRSTHEVVEAFGRDERVPPLDRHSRYSVLCAAADSSSLYPRTALELALLGVSGEFDEEADQLGAQYAWRAGYDPRGFITFFDKMAAEEGYVRSISFFHTHPPFYERIIATFSEVEYLPRKADLNSIQPGSRI